MREDLQLQEKAKSLGWTVERHIIDKEDLTRTPQFPLYFSRIINKVNYLTRTIWSTSIGWRCAECDGLKYFNHRTYKTLAEALEKES